MFLCITLLLESFVSRKDFKSLHRDVELEQGGACFSDLGKAHAAQDRSPQCDDSRAALSGRAARHVLSGPEVRLVQTVTTNHPLKA